MQLLSVIEDIESWKCVSKVEEIHGRKTINGSMEGVGQMSLSIYGCTAFEDLGRFFSFVMYTQSAGLLGWGISPSQGRFLQKEQTHRHPCLEWNSNTRSQCF
jgi:hypothetical protein